MDLQIKVSYYENGEVILTLGIYKARGDLKTMKGRYAFSFSEKQPDDSWQYIMTISNTNLLDAIDDVCRTLIEYHTTAEEIAHANRSKPNKRPTF
jgi:hypothetical protein